MQNNKFIAVSVTVLVILGLVISIFYVLRQNGGQEKAGMNGEIIGGQKDSNGCLVSAGYSWCEAKGKCLRAWEESCSAEPVQGDKPAQGEGDPVKPVEAVEPSQGDIDSIRQAFMEKYKKATDEVQVSINKFDGQFARGGVKFSMKGGFGEGGIFLAFKEEGAWKIAFDGNGLYSCAEVGKHGFPEEMIPDCFKEDSSGSGNASQIANPASVYCKEHGGESEIRTDASGSQSGVCKFADGSECDEWAFFRGECKPKK